MILINESVNRIQNEVKKAVKGKDQVIAKVLMAILAGGNILLEDVPGVGKTTMAVSFAKAMGLDTKRIQFTPDTMPSDITGFSVYDRNKGKFSYRKGAIVTNLLLADEINRTSSRTQAALLEAMEEKKITIEGKTYNLPDPFIVLATQNPVGSAGTQMLPNSQLDRFMIRINMGYPDLESQIDILTDRHETNPLDSVEAVLDRDQLRELIASVTAVNMERDIYEYAAKLVEATRKHEMVTLGMSPRGALALCRIAKAHAFLEGRNYVTPVDVQKMFPDVCKHRLVLNSKARLNEYDAGNIVDEIIAEVEVPAVKEIKSVRDM